jgi:hypothetical protein
MGLVRDTELIQGPFPFQIAEKSYFILLIIVKHALVVFLILVENLNLGEHKMLKLFMFKELMRSQVAIQRWLSA